MFYAAELLKIEEADRRRNQKKDDTLKTFIAYSSVYFKLPKTDKK